MAKSTKELAIELTKWLLNQKSIEPPEEILLPELKYRLFDYCLRNPMLVHYLDEHLNSLYDFDKYTVKGWLLTFKEIFRKFKINNKSQLYFTQFKLPKRSNFKKDIHDYFSNECLSESDFNSLYYLYENGIISDQLINYLKTLSSGKDTYHKQLDIIPTSDTPAKKDDTKRINDNLISFNAFMNHHIQTRIPCRNCALFNKEKQPVFTDCQIDTPEIDVLVITEQPFNVNNSTDPVQILYKLLAKYELTYAFTSLVLCKPDNIIPNAKITIKNCEGIRKYVTQHFTAKLNILIGSKVKSAFGFRGAMSQLNGIYESGSIILTDPISSSQISAFKKAIITVNEHLKKLHDNKNKVIKTDQAEFDYEDLANYTLFDVKVVEEKILYIFLENGTGKKKFITEEISFPVYIKQGNYRDCAYIESEMDLVTYVTNQQRLNLQNQLRLNMYKLINN